MTEKLHPPSTQTATPSQSLPPSKAFSPLIPSVAIPSASSAFPSPSSAAAVLDNVIAVANEPTPPFQDRTVAKAESAAEEEPYTIKCICGYQGDDGNTIYCEICDSWQHIECFYPNNSEEATREEFSHACHDCKPRPLDQRHAVAYQRQRLDAATAEAVGSTKSKRPLSKSHSQSHKKKPKPTDLQLNGHGPSIGDASKHPHPAHDHPHLAHPPAKKTKSSHKSSHSMGGSHPKRSPSYSASRTNFQNGHPLSPATTPPDLPDGVEIHNYSSDFLSLCNEQNTAQIVQTNSFLTLAVSNMTSIWLREPDRMEKQTGHDYSEVFHEPPSTSESVNRPPKVEVKKRVMDQDPVVRWSYLAASEAIDKDVRLLELNGEVGFQKDYCSVPMNRYEELSCPLPFVFFHPLLPLYIDTRREGSLARYVRRSCRPNAVLDTYLSDGSEYHFWLLSDRQIEADEQITIPWDFRLPREAKARMLRILGLGDDDNSALDDVDENEYSSIARWVHQILSEYGGCACDLGADCAFARFHRNYGNRLHQTQNGHSGNGSHKKKSARKPKHALSPTSTGHATNSRAASEGHLDDFAENDKASTSSRSKPPSRDMTPAPRQGSFDTLGILTEPTDRDKRKVAMVEVSFRRLEQQPPKKKKRISDGGVSEKSTSSNSKSKSKGSPASSSAVLPSADGGHADLANGPSVRCYADAATSQNKTDLPVGAGSPQLKTGSPHAFAPTSVRSTTPTISRHTSVAPPSTYCDASVQTDSTTGEWYSEKVATPRPRRRVISLSRRLLSYRHILRPESSGEKIEGPQQPAASPGPNTDVYEKSLPSEAAVVVTETKSLCSAQTDDVPMTDAVGQADGPEAESPVRPSSATATQPASSKAITNEAAVKVPPKKTPDLRVQMPQVPAFSDTTVSSSISVATPVSSSSMMQSPMSAANASPFGSIAVNGVLATPSPVKKKMSLSDYTKSRKAAGGRPLVGTSLKPSISSAEESKPATNVDGMGLGDSPTVGEKSGNASSTLVAGSE